MKKSEFRSLFKLSSARISAAFLVGKRIGSIEGIKILNAPCSAEKTQFIIALTRTIKGSVLRNLLRRRIKGALRNGLHAHGPLPHGVYLCVVYSQAKDLTFAAIESLLKNALWPRQKTHS